MKIVTVTPIDKGVFRDQLTYFSSLPLKAGYIVNVPVRNRVIDALVLETKEVGAAKAGLRQSDFALKKIEGVKGQSFFTAEFLDACQKTADYFSAPLGLTIKSLVPKVILEDIGQTITRPRTEPKPVSTDKDNPISQHNFILQDSDEERITDYKSLIRESFARKSSVFLCLPTAEVIDIVATYFEKGIKDYTIVLHNGLSKKNLTSAWKKAIETDHPILVIGTPMFLSLPRHDIGTFIIDRENSPGYKSLTRPFIDYRIFSMFYTESLKARLIFGDLVLRSETIFKTEKGGFLPLSPLKYRTLTDAEQIIISNKTKKDDKQKLTVISEKLAQYISSGLERKEKLILYCGRKGLAPNTVCNDCGRIVSCERCQSPLVLHRKTNSERKERLDDEKREHFYLCHKCGFAREVSDLCPYCESWQLTLLGFGIDKVAKELDELFPEASYLRLDKDSVPSNKKVKDLIAKFYAPKGPAILLTTEISLPYLDQKIDTVVALALDSLFALPDFRISEKITNVLFKLRQIARKYFIIQTRNPEEKVFQYVAKGNLIDFYRDEIEERMRFKYPPFKTIIKISKEGKQPEVEKFMNYLAEELKDYGPLLFPVFSSRPSSNYKLNLVLKLSPEKWPDPKLIEILKRLPPDCLVDVEPEDVL